MQKKVWVDNGNGQKISAIIHIPKKVPASTVIVCHGFPSSKFKKKNICEFFAKHGYAAIRFDFNGNGESYGDFKDFTITKCVDDLSSIVDFAKKQKFFNGRLALTGTSQGGRIIIIYASENPDKCLKTLIPVCPTFTVIETDNMKKKEIMEKWKTEGYRFFNVRTKGPRREKKPLKYDFFKNSLSYKMRKITKKIKIPVLLIHGDRDKNVPLRHSRFYYKNLSGDKKLIILKGAGHNHEFRKKDTKIVHSEMLKWLKRYLKN